MSTNQTQRYNLHLWEPGDDFLREEFNANFAALDGAVGGKCGLVMGTYTGDGAESRFIDLGFTPRAVILCNEYGVMSDGAYSSGGVALEGKPSLAFSLSEGGVTVRFGNHFMTNCDCVLYYYLAFR